MHAHLVLHDVRKVVSISCSVCLTSAIMTTADTVACLCRIGQPLSGTQELHEVFSKYDTNHSGQLEFNEFLVLFKDRLTDVQKTLDYISLKPAKSKSTAPSVMEVRLSHTCVFLSPPWLQTTTLLCLSGSALCHLYL